MTYLANRFAVQCVKINVMDFVCQLVCLQYTFYSVIL